MNKIKVIHLIKTLNLGGAEINLYNLIQAIDHGRFEVHIGYSFGGVFEEKFRASGIKLFKFAHGDHKIKSFATFGIIIRLIRYILRYRIDIIHSHSLNAHIWGSVAAKITRRKTIEHVHDFRYFPVDELKRRKGMVRQFKYLKYLRMSDIVIVLTRQNYNFLVDKKYYLEKNVREMQNGICVSNIVAYPEKSAAFKKELGIPDDCRVVLTPCRISPEKNVDIILRIAPVVAKTFKNVIFLISGDGPSLTSLKRQCQELQLDGIVKSIGFYENIYELLSFTDILLLPSFVELHSIAILEALSMKIPVIASQGVGCNDEFIKSWENGILLNPFSDQGWTESILKLLQDDSLLRKIGQAGYQTCVENFNINDIARKIESLYVELAKK
ncbi:glycosyltransferase [Candidatus Omnitrophota bacterium]